LASEDRDLLKRAREYDEQALTEIYDRYAEAIYRYLYRLLGDAHLAEDLTSDAFLKLVQVLGTSRAPRDELRGWLYRVAHNLAVDWFRKEAKAGTLLTLNEDLAADDASPLVRLENHQVRQRLRRAIRQLTLSQQQVLVLRFSEGLKLEEVGRLMGKDAGAIKLIQYRALRRLRKLLEREEEKQDDRKRL
jgi:RNA polymerase sigma-70 factor (ECF subfamily)